MSIGICRVQKIGAAKDIAGIQIHNRRERTNSNTNPDIDHARSSQNYTLTVTPNEDLKDGMSIRFCDAPQATDKPYNAFIDERIKQGYTGKKAVRKDAVRCCEVLFTASGDFFDQNPKLTKHFFRLCVAFAAKRFGIDNIIAATVHMDEETPHLHLDFVPLTADGRLSAKSILGGRKEMQQLQDDFYEQVSRRFGLERGSRADLDAADPDEQPRKHLTTRELKAATAAQLAEQEQQIDLNQTELQALEQQIDLNQTELQALEQALDGVQEQLREVRRQLNQLDAEKRKAVLTANDAEQHAILAEGRAEQADKRAETAEIRLHSAETRLSEINAQYDAAAKELGDVLGKKARAAEIHKLGDLFGETVHYHKNMLESTRAIGYEAHQKLQKALSALEEAKALEVRAKALQAQIEPLQRQAQADRDAAAQLRQEQEQLIQSRAAELTDKRIKSMFGATPDSRRERLERFCEKVKLPDGKTVLDVFEEQERRLRAKGKNFHGIS